MNRIAAIRTSDIQPSPSQPKCGLGLSYACVLDKGHEGDCHCPHDQPKEESKLVFWGGEL